MDMAGLSISSFNLIDLLIIVFLILGAISGYRQGLIGGLAGLAAGIVGFIAALNYYLTLAGWFNLHYQIQAGIQAYLKAHFVLPSYINQLRLDRPLTELSGTLDKLSLPVEFKAQLITYIKSLGPSLQAQTALGDAIYQFLATLVVNALAFFLIWLCTYIVIMLVTHILLKITERTFISGLDHGIGLLLGLALQIIGLAILFGLLTPILQLSSFESTSLLGKLPKALGDSQLVPYFQDIFQILSMKLSVFWQ